MREVDDQALLRSSIFVDSYATTLDHIGELKIPLADGVISREHVRADYYQADDFKRCTDDEITLFKNGGGCPFRFDDGGLYPTTMEGGAMILFLIVMTILAAPFIIEWRPDSHGCTGTCGCAG